IIQARAPTLRRKINISNGLVARSRHSPSGVNDARCSSGRAQYGPRRISPSGDRPKGEDWYQMKPKIVPTNSAAKEITMRIRSSCRCSTRVISPAGFFFFACRLACDCLRRSITAFFLGFAGILAPARFTISPEFSGGMPVAIYYFILYPNLTHLRKNPGVRFDWRNSSCGGNLYTRAITAVAVVGYCCPADGYPNHSFHSHSCLGSGAGLGKSADLVVAPSAAVVGNLAGHCPAADLPSFAAEGILPVGSDPSAAVVGNLAGRFLAAGSSEDPASSDRFHCLGLAHPVIWSLHEP